MSVLALKRSADGSGAPVPSSVTRNTSELGERCAVAVSEYPATTMTIAAVRGTTRQGRFMIFLDPRTQCRERRYCPIGQNVKRGDGRQPFSECVRDFLAAQFGRTESSPDNTSALRTSQNDPKGPLLAVSGLLIERAAVEDCSAKPAPNGRLPTCARQSAN